jgi:hypothetical protein
MIPYSRGFIFSLPHKRRGTGFTKPSKRKKAALRQRRKLHRKKGQRTAVRGSNRQ